MLHRDPHGIDLNRGNLVSLSVLYIIISKKMYSLGFGIFLLILFNSYSVSTGHWIPDLRSARLLEDTADDLETNQTTVFDVLNETSVINTTESDILFWTAPKTNDTIEPDSEVQLDTNETSENANYTSEIVEDDVPMNDSNSLSSNLFEVVQDNQKYKENINSLNNNVSDYAMDEKIVLQRNNCNLEIALQDTQDLKITIMFGKLEDNTSGNCCITLNGPRYNKLGVLVSNIQLYQNGEILKVIIADYGNDYVLKEYYPRTKYHPLLLTETNKVYLVLNYNVTSVSTHEHDSYFNLEVITYHKQENHFHNEDSYSGTFFPNFNHGMSKFPESHPVFTPYYK